MNDRYKQFVTSFFTTYKIWLMNVLNVMLTALQPAKAKCWGKFLHRVFCHQLPPARQPLGK